MTDSSAVLPVGKIVKAERRQRWAERRTALAEARDRYPGSRGSERARTLLLDYERFEEFVEEYGGDAGVLQMLCAQVASKVTLTTLCEHYAVDYGLLWDWIGEDKARVDRYYWAQRGVADAQVSETVSIADAATVDNVQVAKLKIGTRMQVAGKFDRERFGERAMELTIRNEISDPGKVLAEIAALEERLGLGVRKPVTLPAEYAEILGERDGDKADGNAGGAGAETPARAELADWTPDEPGPERRDYGRGEAGEVTVPRPTLEYV